MLLFSLRPAAHPGPKAPVRARRGGEFIPLMLGARTVRVICCASPDAEELSVDNSSFKNEHLSSYEAVDNDSQLETLHELVIPASDARALEAVVARRQRLPQPDADVVLQKATKKATGDILARKMINHHCSAAVLVGMVTIAVAAAWADRVWLADAAFQGMVHATNLQSLPPPPPALSPGRRYRHSRLPTCCRRMLSAPPGDARALRLLPKVGWSQCNHSMGVV